MASTTTIEQDQGAAQMTLGALIEATFGCSRTHRGVCIADIDDPDEIRERLGSALLALIQGSD